MAHSYARTGSLEYTRHGTHGKGQEEQHTYVDGKLLDRRKWLLDGDEYGEAHRHPLEKAPSLGGVKKIAMPTIWTNAYASSSKLFAAAQTVLKGKMTQAQADLLFTIYEKYAKLVALSGQTDFSMAYYIANMLFSNDPQYAEDRKTFIKYLKELKASKKL